MEPGGYRGYILPSAEGIKGIYSAMEALYRG
jgi:hypothetical protein